MKKHDIALSIEAIRDAHRYIQLRGYCVTDKKFKDLWWEIYQREITIP